MPPSTMCLCLVTELKISLRTVCKIGLRCEPICNPLQGVHIVPLWMIKANRVEKDNTIVAEMFIWDYHLFEISGTRV